MQIGTIWIFIGSFVIAGGLFIGSLLVQYGNKLNQQASEQKILTQQKNSETVIIGAIKNLEDEVAKMQKDKEQELNSEFPAGYQLFGVIDKQIVPSAKPLMGEIKIDWSTAKILSVTKDSIAIMLPDAVFPGNNVLKSNTIVIANKEGAMDSSAFNIGGWLSFVKILKSDEKRVIAAVGYVRQPSHHLRAH